MPLFSRHDIAALRSRNDEANALPDFERRFRSRRRVKSIHPMPFDIDVVKDFIMPDGAFAPF